MKVKIKATGFGVTALQDGSIIHFDHAEAKAKSPDKRKLEAEVELEDARRIKALGWCDFKDPGDEPTDGSLSAAAVTLEQAPEIEQGLPTRVDVREGSADEADAPKAKALKKPAARKRPAKAKPAKPAAAPAAPAEPPVQAVADDEGSADEADEADDNVGGIDPDAGPA